MLKDKDQRGGYRRLYITLKRDAIGESAHWRQPLNNRRKRINTPAGESQVGLALASPDGGVWGDPWLDPPLPPPWG